LYLGFDACVLIMNFLGSNFCFLSVSTLNARYNFSRVKCKLGKMKAAVQTSTNSKETTSH
jgi:hypothetical protein